MRLISVLMPYAMLAVTAWLGGWVYPAWLERRESRTAAEKQLSDPPGAPSAQDREPAEKDHLVAGGR
jgi:hypothetical protein